MAHLDIFSQFVEISHDFNNPPLYFPFFQTHFIFQSDVAKTPHYFYKKEIICHSPCIRFVIVIFDL